MTCECCGEGRADVALRVADVTLVVCWPCDRAFKRERGAPSLDERFQKVLAKRLRRQEAA